jgi:hypothetical protein
MGWFPWLATGNHRPARVSNPLTKAGERTFALRLCLEKLPHSTFRHTRDWSFHLGPKNVYAHEFALCVVDLAEDFAVFSDEISQAND